MEPHILGPEESAQLSTALEKAQAELQNFNALPVGSKERVEKWRELEAIGGEINAYFFPLDSN